jgi:alcohol dehydrogenase (cytochrome c)
MKLLRASMVVALCVSASLAPVHAQRGPTQEELNNSSTSSEWLLPHHDYAGQRFVDLKEITPANASSLRPVCIYQAGDLGRFATNPLVYQGTLYFTTGVSTIALDAATCRQRWRYDWKAKGKESFPSNRGAAIKDGKIIRGTNDGYLIALDAGSGQLLWDRQVSDPEKFEKIGTAPLVYEDLIIIGVGVSELGVKGWLGAFQLGNGEPVWRFNTVPDAGESGAETWGNPEALQRGGGAVWMPPSLDIATGLIYVPVGNPTPYIFGTVRPGTNLYTNAMVVLDAKTGALRWYKQFVPHDTHDWDVAVTSPLFTTDDAGTRRRLVTVAGKDGLLRVLNRDSHEELYSVAITTRSNEEVEPTVEGVHTCPGASGGALWSSPALNPIDNMLFVASIDWCGVFKKAEELRFVPGQFYGGGTYAPDPVEKSHGWLTAINAGNGLVRWKYESARPLLAAVTASAGGVLFTGELTGDFLVIDSKDGKVLYRFYAGGPITGGVVSYAVKGKQYVAVASGAATGYWQAPGGAATILVFSLP